MNWSFYEAIARIPLAVAVTIEFAGPLLVAVLGSRRPLDLVWLALAAGGIVLLVDPRGGAMDPAGVGFALAAAACWMAYIYLSKRTGAAFPGGAGLALAMAAGALIVLPAGVIRAGGALVAARPAGLGARRGARLLGAAVLARARGAATAPEAVFGVLMSLDPAVAALAGWLLLDQDLGARELLAIAMVVVASAGAAGLSHGGPGP